MERTANRNFLLTGLLVLIIGVIASMGTLSVLKETGTRNMAQQLQGARPLAAQATPRLAKFTAPANAISGGSLCCACNMLPGCAPTAPEGDFARLARDFGPSPFTTFDSPPQSDPPRT